MNEKEKLKISKFLSLILRHQPDAIGLALDANGWASVDELIARSAVQGRVFSLEDLKEVVATNDKQRFSFDESGKRIRANQGHSVRADLDFEEKRPPGALYHGTAERNAGQIFKTGLKKMKRHHVHLSADEETARRVGIRYGKPVIFRIDTLKMLDAGFKFYVSANGVWLVGEVPPEFLEVL